MKRLFALLISLCLVLSLTPVLAQTNHNQLLGGLSPDSIAATEDALFALKGRQLWRWQPVQPEAVLVAEGFAEDLPEVLEAGMLLALGGILYHFHQQSGLLRQLEALEGKIRLHSPVQYPADRLVDADGQPRLIKNIHLTSQGLWLLMEGAEGGVYELFLLTEGQAWAFKQKGLISIAPYKDGKLLVIQGKESGKPSLASFDPGKEKLKVLVKSLPRGADGLCYDSGTDTPYYFSNGDIIAHPGLGKGKTVAHLPALYLFRNPVLLKGHLAVALPDGLYIRSLTASAQKKPRVRVYRLDQFTLNRVRALVPDIEVVSPETWYIANELAQAVITGSFDYDVANLELANPQLYKLMDKGYLAKLSAYPDIARLAQRIHPVYLTPLTKDDGLYGLPESIRINSYSYNPAVLDKLGLAPDDLLQDLLSLTDFLASWRERFSQFDGQILPLNVQDRQALVYTMTDLYIQEHLLRGLPLSFDTPLFREIMGSIEGLDTAYLGSLHTLIPENKMPQVLLRSNSDLRVLSRYRSASPFNAFTAYEPHSLRLSPGLDALHPFSGSYAVMMEAAADKEAAARVLAAINQSDWGQKNAPIMYQDYQPQVSNNYLESRRSMEEYGKSLTAQLARAKGAEQSNLEQALKEHQEELLMLEEMRFVANLEEVARFQTEVLHFLAPLGPQPHGNLDNQEDGSFLMLFRQFTDGALDVEQFIAQAERILRMIAREEN